MPQPVPRSSVASEGRRMVNIWRARVVGLGHETIREDSGDSSVRAGSAANRKPSHGVSMTVGVSRLPSRTSIPVSTIRASTGAGTSPAMDSLSIGSPRKNQRSRTCSGVSSAVRSIRSGRLPRRCEGRSRRVGFRWNCSWVKPASRKNPVSCSGFALRGVSMSVLTTLYRRIRGAAKRSIQAVSRAPIPAAFANQLA